MSEGKRQVVWATFLADGPEIVGYIEQGDPDDAPREPGADVMPSENATEIIRLPVWVGRASRLLEGDGSDDWMDAWLLSFSGALIRALVAADGGDLETTTFRHDTRYEGGTYEH